MNLLDNLIWHMKMEGIFYPVWAILYKCGIISNIKYQGHRNKRWDKHIAEKKRKNENYRNEVEGWIKYCMPDKVSYDLDCPKTFNEKIQWLKIYDATPLKTKLVDKYAVRDWVADKIGNEHLIPLAYESAVWDNANDIDFAKLPTQFVLKANHGSGMNLIVKDKNTIDKNATRKIAQQWLNTTYGWFGFETQYFAVPRKIIAEKYMKELDGNLLDYKVFCFNGDPQFFQIIGNRDLVKHTGKMSFYDLDWNLLEFDSGDYPLYDKLLERPSNLDEMIRIARTLADGFKFVRVDLYDIDGKIYFGEMTFTPGNGILPWHPMSINEELGKLIEL